MAFMAWNWLWKSAPAGMDNLPVWTWISAATLGTILLLRSENSVRAQPSSRELAFLFASPVWASLTSLGIRELVYFYFRNRDVFPLGQRAILAMNIGLPFLVFHLVLLLQFFPDRPFQAQGTQKLRPLPLAALIAGAFLLVFLFIFRIGYSVNDDIYIVSLAAGQLGGAGIPFLIHINILLGLPLRWLYSLPSNLNWFMIILITVNFLSVWGAVHLILSRRLAGEFKLAGVLALLVCDSYFLLNPTYTTIVAFAATVGLGLIAAASEKDQPLNKGWLASGILLITFAGLLRLLPVLLVLLLFSPLLFIYLGAFRLQSWALAGGWVSILLLAAWGFNNLYLQSSPTWKAYYEYNAARIKIYDTPRLNNLKDTMSSVGWSKVDLAAFQHSFSPDPQTYSRENLESLAAHTSDKRGSLFSVLLSIPERLSSAEYLPYGLVLLSALAGILLLASSPRKAFPAWLSVAGLSLAVIAYLLWTQKLPDRILMPILAVDALAAWIILLTDAGLRPAVRPGRFSVAFLLLVAVGLTLAQSTEVSQRHILKQQLYQDIVSDLETLQNQGGLVPNALILSPAFGVPLEWSNPLYVDFPDIHYMTLGWLAFSPAYEGVLQQAQAASLPEGLYENDNLYLMTDPGTLKIIVQFIEQHQEIRVNATEMLDLSRYTGDEIYEKVRLYKLSRP
jgi:hypothetical protein